MSEQEKKSGVSAIEGSGMMVENTTGGRLKQPYRPNELQDNTDLHRKRPRAPFVPSVAEELKYYTEDTALNENETKERMECEGVPMSEKKKQSVAKKLTSNTERREHSPESLTLASIEADRKKGAVTTLPQPIPDVQSTTADFIATEKEAITRIDEQDDSITEEVEELQTPEVTKKHSEWSDDEEAGGLPRSDSRSSRVSRMKANSSLERKKGISWNNNENIILRDLKTKKSEVCMLDRKDSVGPCFKHIAPFEGPSGITICLPKKSTKCVNQASGININISRKCLAKSKSTVNEMVSIKHNKLNPETQFDKVNDDIKFATFFDNVKDKVNNVQSKIKRFFRT